jgi:hypothetical protein
LVLRPPVVPDAVVDFWTISIALFFFNFKHSFGDWTLSAS